MCPFNIELYTKNYFPFAFFKIKRKINNIKTIGKLIFTDGIVGIIIQSIFQIIY